MNDERARAHIPVPLAEEEWLSNRTLELINLLALTPVTSWDRATPWHRDITNLAPESTQWHDKAEYVDRSYLAHEAKRLLAEAINNGTAAIYADLPMRGHQRLDPRVFFGPNAWNTTTLQTGRYMPLNETFGDDGPTRALIRYLPLWIRNEDWPSLRDAILARRRELSGSSFPSDWQSFVNSLGFGGANADAGDLAWTLHEAVTWVAATSDVAVREQREIYDRYVAKGPHAGPRAWISVTTLIAQQFCTCGQKPVDCYCTEEATKILKRACADGRVPATGILQDGSSRGVVGPLAFENAELTALDEGSLVADARHGGGLLFKELRFDRDAVRRLAEAPAEPSPRPKQPTLSQSRDVEEWYKARVKEADDAGFSWSRDEDCDAGAELGLRGERVRELRRRFADHRRKQGRPTAAARRRKAEFISSRG